MDYLSRLKRLYENSSKHSGYQILPTSLEKIINLDRSVMQSRFESERLDFIIKNVKISDKSILDIGGNCGYFTFEALDAGADMVHYYEGNSVHSDFVRMASEVLGYKDKVEVVKEYYSFKSENKRKYEVTFLLNVLHHFGDDYGDSRLLIDDAKEGMAEQLRSIASITDILVFQLGYCWKGNSCDGLFENGTKSELIEYVTNAVSGVFNIERIGVPVKKGDSVVYVELDDFNIVRNDELGEFLNRPIFIMSTVI